MEEKRGNQLRYLNESLMQDFLNRSKKKHSLEHEVVKKLQELLHDLFFVIVFFSSLSFYRGL